MAEAINGIRNSCSLHGALKSIKAVSGFTPIIHSNPGCAIHAGTSESSKQGLCTIQVNHGFSTPSTNIIEKQVIFGGTSRLREQIKNTVKVHAGDLYLVVTGCAAEIVGDDVPAMVKEAREQDIPAIYVNAPGFSGDEVNGYKLLFKSFVEQYELISPFNRVIEKGLVNIVGIIPEHHPFWEGTFQELERLLSRLGLRVNPLFGYGATLRAWENLPSAELNIAVSASGVEVAQHLMDSFGTTYFEFESIPVGVEATFEFLREILQKLNLDKGTFELFEQEEFARFGYYLNQLANVYFKYDFQKYYALVGDYSTVLGISRFIEQTLGLIPKTLIITEGIQERDQDHFREQLNGGDQEVHVYFTEDTVHIHSYLLEEVPEIIFGSALEGPIAKSLEIPLLQITTPVSEQLVLKKHYAGIEGAILLLEELSRVILSFES